MSLPIMHTDDKDLQLLQTKWASELNPVLGNPLANGTLLRNVQLVIGPNYVSHKLGRKLQGWLITRARSFAAIYDIQDDNPHQNLTLGLQVSANVVVDIYVF